MHRRSVAMFTVAMMVVALAACSSSRDARDSAVPSASGSITVFAAASLTEAFTQIGKQFEASHPGVKVTFSFAGSSALATQITAGAPADVFASASSKNMARVVAAGDASKPTVFARNTMEIAVPPTNPAGVKSIRDLSNSAVKVAVCQPQVPCGVAAAKVLVNAKITVKPVTFEPDVKSVLTKVELGEVDAGMVYVTDVQAAGTKVIGVPISAAVNASTSYPIATLTKSSNASTAAEFVAYVLSPAGRNVLTAAGFQQP
jgi:molybdate transport system substrate-binding protein